MKAAVTLARRGHSVTLLERERARSAARST